MKREKNWFINQPIEILRAVARECKRRGLHDPIEGLRPCNTCFLILSGNPPSPAKKGDRFHPRSL